MNAGDLIGKKAIRSQECDNSDLSKQLLTNPVLIEKVTDTHIICKLEKTERKGKHDITLYEPIILGYIYCDDNWIDYDEFTQGTSIREDPLIEKEREKLIYHGVLCLIINSLIAYLIYRLLHSFLDLNSDVSVKISISFFSILFAIEYMYPSFKELRDKYKKRGKENEK